MSGATLARISFILLADGSFRRAGAFFGASTILASFIAVFAREPSLERVLPPSSDYLFIYLILYSII
jgi:hypothetical protein